MSLVLVTPPAVEPIELEAAKLHLRLEDDFNDDDDLVLSLIPTARRYIEDITQRALITQTWRLTRDGFPGCYDVISLDRPNLLTVTSVKYIDTAGVEQTMSTSDYTVDLDAFPGRIFLNYQKLWPTTRLQRNAVTVLFTCGYGATADLVPDPLKAAMKLLIGHWYENREAVNVGNIVTPLEMAVDALVGPYRYLQVA